MSENSKEQENSNNAIHFSLLYPLTLGGIDKRLAALIFMSMGILYMALRSFVIFIPGILFYIALRRFYKKDYFILDVYKQYIASKKKYYK